MKYSEFLKSLDSCPFCDCPPGRMLKENKTAFLTYSKAPYHPDHLLVCPKRHIEHILDLTQEELNDVDALQKEGLKILNNLKYTNVSFMVREGDGSGKSIKHLHYHIIPNITLGAGDASGKERTVLSEDEAGMLLLRLKSAI